MVDGLSGQLRRKRSGNFSIGSAGQPRTRATIILDMKRLRVHSPQAMQGRMFVHFVALAISVKVRDVIESSSLSRNNTIPEIVNEMKSFQKIMMDGCKKTNLYKDYEVAKGNFSGI